MNKKHTHSLQHYASQYGVSLATIKRYTKAGVDLDDPAAFRKHISEQKHAPKGHEDPDKKALQIRKLTAECVRLERENAVEAGELISLAQYMEINGRVDAEICKGLDNLADEYAPKVFGMKTIADVTVKLREATDRIKEALHAPVRDPENH